MSSNIRAETEKYTTFNFTKNLEIFWIKYLRLMILFEFDD